MAGGVHSSVLLAARGSVSGVDPSPKLRGAAADEAQTMHARNARASCTPDEPEPALTSARGSMIAGSLERTDKMPARAEEQLLFGSGRVAHCSRRHVEPVLLDNSRWLLAVSFTPCGSPQLQRTAPKVRGPPGLRGLPGSTSRQFCARQAHNWHVRRTRRCELAYIRRTVANSVSIPTVCGRPGKPLVLFANRAGA
ncbi:hypothetical protein EV121DRAFT_277196 [Schizophyllum commune]